MMETFSKLKIERKFLKLIKDNYRNHLANIILNGKQTLFPKDQQQDMVFALTTST